MGTRVKFASDPSIRSLRLNLGSMRVRLVGLLVLALLPAFGVMIFNASESRSRAIEEAEANALRLTELAAANQRQLIDGARDILITMAQIPAILSQDRAACLFFLSNVLMQHPLYANFGAVDGQGDVFCMTLPQRMPINVAGEDYFQNSIATNDFALSEYQISPINSQAVITLSFPVLSTTGETQGIVFANLDLRWLGQFMVSSTLPDGSALRAIDRRGMILASYPDGEIEIGQLMPEHNIQQIMFKEKAGITHGRETDGVARIYAFKSLPAGGDSDIYIVISIPSEAAILESNRHLKRNLSGLAVGGVLALATAWVGSYWFFLRQVNELVDVTKQLSAGDLTARTKCPSDRSELDHLAHAFDDMAEALQRRDQEQIWAKNQIRRQTEHAEALMRIAGHLNARLELESVLHAVCDETSQALKVPAAAVVVYQDDREDLYHVSGPALPARVRDLRTPPSPDKLKGSIIPSDNTSVCIDVLVSPTVIHPAVHQSLDVRYLIFTNLIHEGDIIGRLELFTTDGEEVGEDELTLLQGIADGAAMAITNARLYTALRNEERARADLLHQVISAQEDERIRIARELHDETSQSLTALLVGLDTIRIATHSDVSRIDRHVHDLKLIAEDLLDNIHRLIADLRPSHLDDLGLTAAIQWHGERRVKPQEIDFRLVSNLRDKRLPPPVETALFRIAQEGITNALRHAQASEIIVRVHHTNDMVVLEIVDDGQGFGPESLDSPKLAGRGLGLHGIRERAVILGGSLEIQATPGVGVVVRVCIPISHHERSYDENTNSSC